MAALPPSDGIKALLSSYAATAGYAIEVGTVPTSPDKCITIADTGGDASNPKWLLNFPTVQVRTRGVVGKYNETWELTNALKELCVGAESFTHTNSDRYVSITLLADVAYIGKDDNNRPEFSFNLQLIVEPATTAETNREPL